MPVVNDPDQDREPDRIGPKIAAGLTVAVAGVLGGPDAAVVLGAASPLFESLAERAWEELRPDARRRAAQVLSTAAEAAGCDAEQLGDFIGGSEQTRLQAALAMVAAERTTWPPKVRALGRVLAAGLIADGDAVDVPGFALNAMVELDRLHVSLLELLVRYHPAVLRGYEAELDGEPQRREADPSRQWRVGLRFWTLPDILAVRPQLQSVFMSVVGTLVRYGLADQTNNKDEALPDLERYLRRQRDRQMAEESRSKHLIPPDMRKPEIREMERRWSPTELGEQVLWFYLEAGAEAEITDSAAQAHAQRGTAG